MALPQRYEQASELKHEPLEDEIGHIEQEARMILPGIQALFGFQLVAVFNQSFRTELSGTDQRIHLFALLLSALAVLLVLAPAAYHRIAEPGQLSRRLADFSTRMLTLALAPLMTGISLDLYVVSKAVTGVSTTSAALAALLFAGFLFTWFVFPSARARSVRGA